jgi:hypothetical protein
VQCAGLNLLHEPDIFVAAPERLQPEPMAEAGIREVLMAEQDGHALPGTASVEHYIRVRDVIDEWASLQRWQRIPGLRTVANRLNGRLIKSGPAPTIKDLASFRVIRLGQNTRPGIPGRPPPFSESGRDPAQLVLKFWLATRRPPGGPADSGTDAGSVAGHRLAELSGLNPLDEPDDRGTVPAGRVQPEPVTELNPGRVLLGEQDGYALPCSPADNDHLGRRGRAQKTIVRDWIPRLGTVADGLDGHTGKPCLPRLSDKSKGLRIIALGQQLRLAARR